MEMNRVNEWASYFVDGNIQYQDLEGFHNQIYLIEGKRRFILRVADPSHRSKDDTLGEIDFLKFLKEQDVSVAAPIRGLNGEYVQEINMDNETWILSAFEVAKEGDPSQRVSYTDSRLIEIGRTLGKIHKNSKIYPEKNNPRRQWYESQHIKKAQCLFETYNPQLRLKFEEFIEQMKALPRNSDGFGLVHGDYLFTNYLFNSGDLTVIDFDECEYSWFVYDIAVCIYYYLIGEPDKIATKVEEAENVLQHLLSGYMLENQIDARWISEIDKFFKLREYVLLSTLLEQNAHDIEGWNRSFFKGAVNRQLNDQPFIEANFLEIYNACLSK